jgi:hypothetical protein
MHCGRELVAIFPLLRAGRGIERHDVIQRGRDIHRAVDDHRSRFEGVGDAGLVPPGELELLDGGGSNLTQGRKAPVAVIPSV